MEKVILRNLYKNTETYANKNICIEGWVRTIRDSKTFGYSFGKKNKEKKKSKSGYQPKYIAEEEYEDEEDIFAEDFRDVTDRKSVV